MGLLFSEAVDHFPKRLTFEVRTAPSVELAAMSSCSLPAGGQTGASFWGLTQTGLDALTKADPEEQIQDLIKQLVMLSVLSLDLLA